MGDFIVVLFACVHARVCVHACVCVRMCTRVYTCVCECTPHVRSQNRKLDLLVLVKVVVSCLTCVLGTELESPARAVSAVRTVLLCALIGVCFSVGVGVCVHACAGWKTTSAIILHTSSTFFFWNIYSLRP